MTGHARAIVSAALALLVLALPRELTAQTPASPARSERLAALRPDNPLAYFELGEEVAAEPVALDDRDLARSLFVLAASLAADRKPDERTSPDWLASSACTALVPLADNEPERRWLRALAATLAPEESRSAVQRAGEVASADSAARDLAAALDSLRAGYGQRAARILERPGVNELLDRYERLLSPDGRSGGAARVRALVARFGGCRECRNERVVRDRDGTRLCPTCGGRPGPKLDGEELVGQLRLESLLVNGIQRSWAAQTIADDGAPLRELDIASLADAYRIDTAKPWWRDGRWSANPDGDRKPADDPAPATPAPSP
ncbi:MAG: hypothetical protein ACK4WH_08240 [Phycisphaerales bacterium]